MQYPGNHADDRRQEITQALAFRGAAAPLLQNPARSKEALNVLGPLVEKYPANPLFQLARGDLFAKLGRKQQALACYRAVSALPVQNAECQAHVRDLARASIASLGVQ